MKKKFLILSLSLTKGYVHTKSNSCQQWQLYKTAKIRLGRMSKSAPITVFDFEFTLFSSDIADLLETLVAWNLCIVTHVLAWYECTWPKACIWHQTIHWQSLTVNITMWRGVMWCGAFSRLKNLLNSDINFRNCIFTFSEWSKIYTCT